jgi:large subunit ribosomal protein L30
MATFQVKYKKSSIGYKQDQKDTIRKLGLRRLNQTVVLEDTPAHRGMVNKVVHLVEVSEEVSK